MITAIIIDDEQHCTDRISALLQKNCNHSISLLRSIDNIDEALDFLKTAMPQLIFLDVEIGKGTGFDFLKKAGAINAEVIFTTAHNKYAVEAFKFSAVDYLLKPVDEDDFIKAVDKALHKISLSMSGKNIETLLYNLQATSVKKIMVPTMNGFEVINVPDIIRCQSDVNYTTLYLTGNKSLMVAKTLKEFEVLLADYKFFRVHNSHVVNLNCVKSYNKGKGGYVTLSDGEEIEVSTRRKEEFLKALSKL